MGHRPGQQKKPAHMDGPGEATGFPRRRIAQAPGTGGKQAFRRRRGTEPWRGSHAPSERASGCPSGKTDAMPRQRAHHSRRTYDFPERLKRFQEESGLPWAEIDRRLGIHPYTIRRWIQGLDPAQRAAHDGAARPGRRPGTGPHIHRVGKVVRAGETAADRNPY